MKKEKVNLKIIPETKIQTLYARAEESKRKDRKFTDKKAEEIVERIDYDFSEVKDDEFLSDEVVAATLVLDDMIREYLVEYPDALVINLGAGLDSRFYRLDNGTVNWINIDSPEVMEIRKRFFEKHERVKRLSYPPADPEWHNEIPKDKEHILVVMEDLSMHIEKSELNQIFKNLSKYFPNAVILIEVMDELVVNYVKEMTVDGEYPKFTYGVQRGIDIEEISEGFRYMGETSIVEGMGEVENIFKVLKYIPYIRNMYNRIVILQGVRE